MSLPKRDGVHDRYYLIHKPDTAPEVLAEADACIQDILDGTARENHAAYPTVVRNHNGTPFLPDQLLERYLFQFPLKGFPYEDAVAFCDALRRLVGWKEIDYTLRQYIEKQVQDRYFEVGEREDFFTAFPPCTVWPELRPEDVDEGLLRFACYVAVSYTHLSYVALCGTSEQAMLWMLEKDPRIQRVVLCLDHDAAGIEATGRLTDILREHGHTRVSVLRPEYKDWDEDLKALNGRPAQPAEQHPQLQAAELVCARIAVKCMDLKPDGAMQQVPHQMCIRDRFSSVPTFGAARKKLPPI